MNTLLLAASLALSLVAPLAFASERNTNEETADENNESKSSIKSCSNACIRHKGNVGIQLGFGFPGTVVPGTQLGLYWITNNDWQLGLSYAFGSGATGDLYTTGEDGIGAVGSGSYEMALTAVNARYFLTDTFFLAGHLGRRTIDLDLRTSVVSPFLFFDYSQQQHVTVRSLVAGISIGNQWNFSNGLYITGEWLGVSAPLNYTSTSNYSGTSMGGTGDATQSIGESNKRLAKTFGMMRSLQASISLGYLF